MRNAWVLASVLCACAREVPPRTVPPAVAKTVSVSVHVVCDWPLAPDGTQIMLDGLAIPDGVPVATTDSVHTVEVVTDVSVACGLLSSSRARIRVNTAQSLAATGPAAVDVYVFDDGDPTQPAAARLHTRWALQGATIEREYHGATPSACAVMSAARRAECRVASRLEIARRQKDVVEALCEYGKLDAIRKALPRADAGDSEAASAILKLEHQALHCVGGGPGYVGDTAISERDDCGPEIPAPALETELR